MLLNKTCNYSCFHFIIIVFFSGIGQVQVSLNFVNLKYIKLLVLLLQIILEVASKAQLVLKGPIHTHLHSLVYTILLHMLMMCASRV